MLGDWGEFVTGLFTYPAYYLTVSAPSLLSSYTNFSLKISGVFLNAHEGPLLYLMHQTECYYILTCTYRYLWVLLRLKCLVKVPLNISIEEYHNCDHFIIQQQQWPWNLFHINLNPKFESFPIVKICWSGNHICEEIVSLIFYGKGP